MKLAWLVLVGAAAAACASTPPPVPAAAPPPEETEPAEDPTPAPAPVSDAPERSRPVSTATYDEALATPERLDVHDERAHLTDLQLTGPMRSALVGCRMPWNAKVTIKTAVQNGRAIGVTVLVRFELPKGQKPPKRPPSLAAQKAEAKAKAKIATCVDRNVRNAVWPPSSRRDSFTTEL